MTTDQTQKSPIYVYVKAVRCPVCESASLKLQRSVANGDGSRTKYYKCLECETNFILVVE